MGCYISINKDWEIKIMNNNTKESKTITEYCYNGFIIYKTNGLYWFKRLENYYFTTLSVAMQWLDNNPFKMIRL